MLGQRHSNTSLKLDPGCYSKRIALYTDLPSSGLHSPREPPKKTYGAHTGTQASYSLRAFKIPIPDIASSFILLLSTILLALANNFSAVF